MQDSVDHCNCRNPLLGVNPHRDAASVVGNADAVSLQDFNGNQVTVSCQRLVNGIIHNFIYQVVQASGPVDPIYIPGRLRTASNPSST